MESLEAELQKVERLEEDLSAEIVIQKEEGHYEHFETSWPEGVNQEAMDDFFYGYEEWVVDKPKITEPNTQKRQTAKSELQQVYDFSDEPIARYVAGRALLVNSHELDRIINESLGYLEKQLISEKNSGLTESVAIGEHEEEDTSLAPLPSCDRHAGPDTVYRTITDYEERPIWVPNTAHRLKALEDAKVLWKLSDSSSVEDLLKKHYNNNDSEEVRINAGRTLLNNTKNREKLKTFYKSSEFLDLRIEAGQKLDYPQLRIWAHEHPVKATLTGLATAGIASGLVYALSEYLGR
jgi:hypothetical protein